MTAWPNWLGWGFDAVLAALLLVLAWRAMTVRSLFAGIVFYIVFGLLVAVAWLRLAAPDVALAEAAIGSGLTGVLFLQALDRIGRDSAGPADPASSGPAHPEPGSSRVERGLLAGFCLLFAAGLGAAVLTLPDGETGGAAPGLAAAVAQRLPESGVDNPVTAVLLNFRGYDTLLETGVLLLALIAAWSLTPAGYWGGVPGRPLHPGGPDPVLRGFVGLLAPVAALVGVYLLWAGTHAPGGAFQAGTVLAASGVLLLLADRAAAPATGRVWVRWLLVAGFLVFIGAGLAAMPAGLRFLEYPAGAAKGLILLIETVLTLSIAATLALLAAGLPERPPPRPEAIRPKAVHSEDLPR